MADSELDIIEKVVKTLEKSLFEDRIDELKQILENIAEKTNKEQKKHLESIQKVVDGIKEEVDEQGRDVSALNTSFKNLRAEFESFRDNHKRTSKYREEKIGQIVSDAISDTIQSEVPNAVASVIEPMKHRVRAASKKPFVKRITNKLFFWR